ncbi:hypothetical protein DsansV1_C31g0217181 [Dioscorea sansibarensis]
MVIIREDKISQPVGMNASKLANRSGIDSFVRATNRTMATMTPIAITPWLNLRKSSMFVDFLGLYVKICIITYTKNHK